MDNFNMFYNLRGIEYFEGKKLIVDTCSLMHVGFPIFIEKLSKYNETAENPVIARVPICVYVELSRLMYHENPDTAKIATERMKQLNEYLSSGECRFLSGYCSGFFADNDIQRVVIEKRITDQVVVLTQDVSLCKDIKALSCEKSYSVKGQNVEVCKLTRNGDISEFIIIPDEDRSTFNFRKEETVQELPKQEAESKPQEAPKDSKAVTDMLMKFLSEFYNK